MVEACGWNCSFTRIGEEEGRCSLEEEEWKLWWRRWNKRGKPRKGDEMG